MKVVLDARLLRNEMTGIGRYLLGLVKGFKESKPSFDLEVWIQNAIGPEHVIWNNRTDRINLKTVPLRHMTVSQLWKIPGLLSKSSPDVFHYPHFDLPFFLDCPVVTTIHDLKYFATPEFFPKNSKAKTLILKALMKHACNTSKYIVSVSGSTRNDILKYLDIPEDKVFVVHEGVDERFFQRPTDSIIGKVLGKYHIDSPYILFVGERRPHKNIDGLIRAFAKFREMAASNILLVIAGKRYSDYRKPEETVEALGLEKSVLFLEDISDDEIIVFYRHALFFVTLSKYEGFGLPVLEAMASGIPVVASNVTSLPELVGDAGVLVNLDDVQAIADSWYALYRDTGRMETLRRLSVERAREFTWAKCAARLAEIYELTTKQ